MNDMTIQEELANAISSGAVECGKQAEDAMFNAISYINHLETKIKQLEQHLSGKQQDKQ